jgi:hypothetical protein
LIWPDGNSSLNGMNVLGHPLPWSDLKVFPRARIAAGRDLWGLAPRCAGVRVEEPASRGSEPPNSSSWSSANLFDDILEDARPPPINILGFVNRAMEVLNVRCYQSTLSQAWIASPWPMDKPTCPQFL